MFAVISATAVPEHLHGYLSRFLSRVDTGIYVGTVTPRVADELWTATTRTLRSGRATMVTSSSAMETGYNVLVHGSQRTEIRNFDGIPFPVLTPDNENSVGPTDSVRPISS